MKHPYFLPCLQIKLLTQNQVKMRVSLILAVIEDGTKLPPNIIFKG